MSPRTETKWEQMRRVTSDKIIQAALELFRERGFLAPSMGSRLPGGPRKLKDTYFSGTVPCLWFGSLRNRKLSLDNPNSGVSHPAIRFNLALMPAAELLSQRSGAVAAKYRRHER